MFYDSLPCAPRKVDRRVVTNSEWCSCWRCAENFPICPILQPTLSGYHSQTHLTDIKAQKSEIMTEGPTVAEPRQEPSAADRSAGR